MKNLYDKFIEALTQRYPRKSELVNALIDLLHLEKENIYRRLRKDVNFSAEEVMLISDAWQISIDNIIGSVSEKTRPFVFDIINFADPGEADYAMLEKFNNNLRIIARDPNGRMYEVLNSLPRGLYCRAENLERFFTMKWFYKFSDPGMARPFCDIHITPQMRELDMELIRLEHSIPEVHSIHDARMIEVLVEEIAYYRSIAMITPEETVSLRDDLLTIVDYMEDLTRHGTFRDTGNKMFFYMSHVSIDTECVLYKANSLNVSTVNILDRNVISSLDNVAFHRLSNMIEAARRSSVLMSESNALQQIEFFTSQRKIIMTL